MAEARLPIALTYRDLAQHVLVSGSGSLLAHRAISEHLALRCMLAGGGCLYIDTRGDPSTLWTLRRAIEKVGGQGALPWHDATAVSNFKRLNLDLQESIESDAKVYLWMPLDRLGPRKAEALALIGMGIRAGIANRAERRQQQSVFDPMPFLIADGSGDASQNFWSMVDCGRLTSLANCALAMELPSRRPEDCASPTCAQEIVATCRTQIEMSGHSGSPASWQVKVRSGGRSRTALYPGFDLVTDAGSRPRLAASMGWFKVLMGG